MSKASTPKPLTSEKRIKSTNYRIERVSAFAWKPIRHVAYTDGTSFEDVAFKEDTLDIVLRKLGFLMRADGQAVFEKIKAAAVKAEKTKLNAI